MGDDGRGLMMADGGRVAKNHRGSRSLVYNRNTGIGCILDLSTV